jgi:hypothetical protein
MTLKINKKTTFMTNIKELNISDLIVTNKQADMLINALCNNRVNSLKKLTLSEPKVFEDDDRLALYCNWWPT